MKKAVMIIVITLAASFALKAQPYPQHYLGGAASFISGYGLSYKVYFDEHWAFEPTGFVYYWEDNDSKELNYSIGAEVHYAAYRTKNTIFYLLAGLSKRYFEDENNYVYDPTYDYNSSTIEHIFSVGPGFGFEFLIWEKVAINLELGLLYNTSSEKYYSQYPYTRNESRTHFAGGGGIYYKF